MGEGGASGGEIGSKRSVDSVLIVVSLLESAVSVDELLR